MYSTQYPVNFVENGDRTNQAIEKHIKEIIFLYDILNELRQLRTSDGTPVGAENGDIWWDTSKNKLMRLEDGNPTPLLKTANTTEAKTYTNDDLYMTPASVFEAVVDIVKNSGNVYASTSNYGTVRLASSNTDYSYIPTVSLVSSIVSQDVNSKLSTADVRSAKYLYSPAKINGVNFQGNGDIEVPLVSLAEKGGQLPVGSVTVHIANNTLQQQPPYNWFLPAVFTYGTWKDMYVTVNSAGGHDTSITYTVLLIRQRIQ